MALMVRKSSALVAGFASLGMSLVASDSDPRDRPAELFEQLFGSRDVALAVDPVLQPVIDYWRGLGSDEVTPTAFDPARELLVALSKVPPRAIRSAVVTPDLESLLSMRGTLVFAGADVESPFLLSLSLRRLIENELPQLKPAQRIQVAVNLATIGEHVFDSLGHHADAAFDPKVVGEGVHGFTRMTEWDLKRAAYLLRGTVLNEVLLRELNLQPDRYAAAIERVNAELALVRTEARAIIRADELPPDFRELPSTELLVWLDGAPD